MQPHSTCPTLFPYTTLFRSHVRAIQKKRKNRRAGSFKPAVYDGVIDVAKGIGFIKARGKSTAKHNCPVRNSKNKAGYYGIAWPAYVCSACTACKYSLMRS